MAAGALGYRGMKIERLDANRPNQPKRSAGLLAVLLAVALLIVAVQSMGDMKEQGAELDARESDVARNEARFAAISNAHRKGASDTASALMAMQRFAAEPARDLVERGWNPGMAFLSLDIITASRQIDLVMETRTAQEALSFADWLEREPGTESVAVRRQLEKPDGAVKAVETTLQITWRPFGGVAANRPLHSDNASGGKK
ncbi:MAG: hypothetical protein CL858_19550 [Cupriavidus sp.]|jgi:hypothetical protein|nr:hypothetical protein [Cupriavidus sp.]